MRHPLRLRLGALLLAGTLGLSVLPARAAQYADIDSSHWAYYYMEKAVDLGILQGVGGNRLAPAQTLTWGQFLTLTARTFAGDSYEAALADGLAWDQAGYAAAQEAGLLWEEDELPVTPDTLDQPISRQDAAVLLCRALPESAQRYHVYLSADPTEFSDWEEMDEVRQQAVSVLANCGIVNGKEDGSFGYADTIQRCDGTVLLMRTLSLADHFQAGDAMTLTLRYVDSATGAELQPDRTLETTVGESLYALRGEAPDGYTFVGFDGAISVSSACTVYTALCRPLTQVEQMEADFWDKVDRGEASGEDYMLQDFWLLYQGENYAKYQLLFGTTDKRRFDSQAEASAAMTTVTVPIWRLSGGVKKSSTATLQVHAAIAQDVKDIFTEIYNDPEQFPINGLSGFRYVEGTSGEHNCGTAIDINANENYQIRDGQVLVGSCWEPGSNPWSIGPDSSVVRIFEAHGWSWGGDAWAGYSDDATGYHDYMHFSYMGG